MSEHTSNPSEWTPDAWVNYNVAHDRIREAWHETDRAELLLHFAAAQLPSDRGDDWRLFRACAVILERAMAFIRTAPDGPHDSYAHLSALLEMTAPNVDLRHWARVSRNLVELATRAGRAADAFAAHSREVHSRGEPVEVIDAAELVRHHVPFESIATHWHLPAPFGRNGDGSPRPSDPTDVEHWYLAARHVGLDPERVVAGSLAVVSGIEQHARDDAHAREALEGAREHARRGLEAPDPYAVSWACACAVARRESVCPCCPEDARDAVYHAASELVDRVAVAVLRETWPEAAALMERFAE